MTPSPDDIPASSTHGQPWHTQVRPVSDLSAHVLHSYFNMPPESPDGQWVLAFVSQRPDAQVGDLCLLPRGGGERRVLADQIEVEDAHRQACQQFIAGGSAVVFQHMRDGVWQVEVAEVATGRRRVLAQQRQLGFGQAHLPWVGTMSLHWDAQADGDLRLLDVADGRVIQTVPLDAIRPVAARLFPDSGILDGPASLVFPLISPDGRRLACKIAQPGKADFRSAAASLRQGLFTYDLERRCVTGCGGTWGHPSWHPDSRRIVIVIRGQLHWFDSWTGDCTAWNLPRYEGVHPSFSPDGAELVTDGFTPHELPLGADKWCHVEVVRVADLSRQVIHTQAATGTMTTSWRPAHAHPVFSPDGRRVYFNVLENGWTRLYVAERKSS